MPTTPWVISGQVRAIGGQPVAQARVYFLEGPEPLPDIAALTDVRGAFTLSVPTAGSYRLGCSADGFAPATATVQVLTTDQQPTRVEINLHP